MMFLPQHLAILVPTKDRPDKMRELLQSIKAQNIQLNQVVVVATGQDIRFLQKEFPNLPIDYHHVETRGQIFQRSYGIKQLKKEIKLVCLLDDDHYLLPGALQTMLAFWNQEPRHGAICFNIMDEPPFRWNFFKSIFGMTATKPGRVTRAGFNTRVTHVEKNIKTEWVMGGATVWRREILDENPYEEWDKGFPENEDIYFSFPLGKKYSFVVCAAARAEHRRVTFESLKTAEFGETQIRRRFGLVRRYPFFSIPFAYWGSAGVILENFLRGTKSFDAGYFRIGVGNLKGVFKQLSYDIFSKSPQ